MAKLAILLRSPSGDKVRKSKNPKVKNRVKVKGLVPLASLLRVRV